MPYNYKGDLYKREIVSRLIELGCDVKSIHALNLILEKMGLHEHYLNGWLTTEKGLVYTVGQYRGVNADA